MSKERENLLALATTVGLVLGEDFEKNISSKNLQTKIDEKKAATADEMKNKPEEVEPIDKAIASADKAMDIAKDIQDSIINPDVEKLIDEDTKETETYDDEIIIQRTSPCGNYRAKIKGIKEVARRTPDATEEDIKKSLESGEPFNGWTFSEVE